MLDAATHFLEARARSVAEVRRRLSSAGYRPELVDATIIRLADLGILDDEAFARSWIESRDRARPRGEGALRRELQLKGIERPILDALFEERRALRGSVVDADGVVQGVDVEAARRLLERHRRTLERVADPRSRRQRAYTLLARNGFDPETASEVSRGFEASLAFEVSEGQPE